MKNSETKFKETEIGPIPEEWEIVTIPTIVNNYDNKRKPLSSAERKKVPGSYPYYGAAGVIDWVNGFLLDGKYLLVAEDGSVTDDGGHPTLQLTNGKFWVSNHAHVLQGKDFEETLWLYYQLKNTKIQQFVTGAVQPKLNQENLNSIPIAYPKDQEERSAIISILSSLDDKIELNRQINANLEKIASALFKRWFVDFEFPDENGLPYKSNGGKMVESEMGEVPEGWRVAQLGSVADIIDCLHAKKPDRAESGNNCILLQLNNIGSDGLLDMKEKYFISELDYQKWISRMEATEGDCVITNVGRVGAFSRVPTGARAALGRNMTGIRNKNEFPYIFFLAQYFLSDLYKSELSRNVDVGTILDALNVRNIPKLRLMIPADPVVLERAEDIFSSIWRLKEDNLKSGYYLTEVRDSLLPRLMSGKIRTL